MKLKPVYTVLCSLLESQLFPSSCNWPLCPICPPLFSIKNNNNFSEWKWAESLHLQTAGSQRSNGYVNKSQQQLNLTVSWINPKRCQLTQNSETDRPSSTDLCVPRATVSCTWLWDISKFHNSIQLEHNTLDRKVAYKAIK